MPRPVRSPTPVAGLVEVVDPLGRLGQGLDQLLAGDAAEAGVPGLEESVPERAVGQLHGEDQPLVVDPRPERREQVRVADRPRDLEPPEVARPTAWPPGG